jgi:hypothetical protein
MSIALQGARKVWNHFATSESNIHRSPGSAAGSESEILLAKSDGQTQVVAGELLS